MADKKVGFWVDDINAPSLYQWAGSPEEAETLLRSWAGRTVRTGHTHPELLIIAAKVLGSKKKLLMRRVTPANK